MSTDQKTSNLVESQFPDFVLDDGPNLVAFIKAYYEWTEQSNNVIEVAKNLRQYQDLDTTTAKYLEFFHREILGSIPRGVVADRVLLAKHIKDIYRSRGSELSFRLLFRMLYNEEIEFYYPGEVILRASDGRWIKENSIRLGDPRSGSISSFANKTITGQTSGATALVDRIVNTLAGGAIVDELYLLNIVGTFQDGELVGPDDDDSVNATIVSTSGPLQVVTVTQGGAYHQVDDLVSFSSDSGSGAAGGITATTDISAIEFTLSDGGSGYSLTPTITLVGGNGTGAAFEITSLSNTEILSLCQDTIQPVANCVLETGPYFVSLGANTASVSANLAVANVSSTLISSLNFQNTTVGTINTISTTNYGYGYSTVPTANVYESAVAGLGLSDGAGGIKGNNAVVLVSNAPGAIETVNISTFGTNYSRYDPVTITNTTRSGTQAAIGTPVPSGIVAYPGKYVDTKGWLSWDNRLQDNYYYQEYSYEIGTDQFLSTYKKLVDVVSHPAGTLMFGRVRLYSEANTTVVTVDSDVSLS